MYLFEVLFYLVYVVVGELRFLPLILKSNLLFFIVKLTIIEVVTDLEVAVHDLMLLLFRHGWRLMKHLRRSGYLRQRAIIILLVNFVPDGVVWI